MMLSFPGIKNALRAKASSAFFYFGSRYDVLSVRFCLKVFRSMGLAVICLLAVSGCRAERFPAPEPTADASVCKLDEDAIQRAETVTVSRVYDGDTLTLSDGRKIRLIGVNTPELARKSSMGWQGSDQPYAQQARHATATFVKNSSVLVMYPDREPRDHYGRWLAHIYNQFGESLEQQLLQQGLAYHVVVPPNVSLAECFARAEQRARDSQLGIWSKEGIPPVTAKHLKRGGFQRVQGTVTDVQVGKHWRLRLDDRLTVMLYSEHQHRFQKSWFLGLQGKAVEIQGWVYKVKGQWRIKLETRYGLELL
jgi:micrococcal nuclease